MGKSREGDRRDRWRAKHGWRTPGRVARYSGPRIWRPRLKMGTEDMRPQETNVQRMGLIGDTMVAPVEGGAPHG